MISCRFILLVIVSQICFGQATVVQQGECDAQDKDLLAVKEETVSVLKLLNEENHSEDPAHLSVASSRPQGTNSKSLPANIEQRKENEDTFKRSEGRDAVNLNKPVHKTVEGEINIPSTEKKTAAGLKTNYAEAKSASTSSKSVKKEMGDVEKGVGQHPDPSKASVSNTKLSGPELNQHQSNQKLKVTNKSPPQVTAQKTGNHVVIKSNGGQDDGKTTGVVSNQYQSGKKFNHVSVELKSKSKVENSAFASGIKSDNIAEAQLSSKDSTPNLKPVIPKVNENEVVFTSKPSAVNSDANLRISTKKELNGDTKHSGKQRQRNSNEIITNKLDLKQNPNTSSLASNIVTSLSQQKPEHKTVEVKKTTQRTNEDINDITKNGKAISPSVIGNKPEKYVSSPQKPSIPTPDNQISPPKIVKSDTVSLSQATKLSPGANQRLKRSTSDKGGSDITVSENPNSVTKSATHYIKTTSPNISTENSVKKESSNSPQEAINLEVSRKIVKQDSSIRHDGCENGESNKQEPHHSDENLPLLSPGKETSRSELLPHPERDSSKNDPRQEEICQSKVALSNSTKLDSESEGEDINRRGSKLSEKSEDKSSMEVIRTVSSEKVEEIKLSTTESFPQAQALQTEHVSQTDVQSQTSQPKPEASEYGPNVTTSVHSFYKDDRQPKDEQTKTLLQAVETIVKEELPNSAQPQTSSAESGSDKKVASPTENTEQDTQTAVPSQHGDATENEMGKADEMVKENSDQDVKTQLEKHNFEAGTVGPENGDPRAEALEQNGGFDSDNFMSSWKQKRAHRNFPDESPTKSPTLEFPTVPEGDSFRIHELGLSEGLFVFSYLGSFLSWMQPYDFPVELLRDALWNRLSVVSLITQSLQVEMGFIACLCIGVLLALAAPLFLMIHACCSLVRHSQSSGSWEDDTASSSDNQGNCRRRTLVFLLQTILLLLVAGIVAMFVTNEQLSSAVHHTPKVIHTALSDVTTFLRNSNLQLNFVVTKSLDQAVETASADLDNVETLLGRPIQRELEAETGVDVALDALVDATAAAQSLSNKVDALHEYCGETRGLALVAQERLADLRHQVDMLRRQCPAKDRALCETVEGSGLDVVLQLDSVLNDRRLAGLRRLSQSNLSQVTQQARGEFQFIPMHVEKETREARNGVRRQLLRQKSILDDAVWSIEAITRDLGVRVESARDRALQIVRGTSDLEQWRYLTGIGAAVAVLLVWVLLVGAISCGCCGAEDKAGPTLLVTVGVLCPLYMALWALAMIALLVGGHGEVFVCRPLYDEPGYGALTKLMDKPGILFQRGGGFFSSLLYGNDSLNVPLKDVLMACQQNRPSYPAFNLHQVFNVDSASDHRGWEALHRQLAKLEVNLTDLQLLTPDLQLQLQNLLNAASVNLTTHRIQLSGPVTGKDLLSFSDQLESVANQITDLATASRMETLATRTRRLLASHIGPLSQRKEDMVYQLTALEVQLVPLQRQVNQSLSHLKTIQFFINNQGANISHIKSQEYINRIVGYLQQYRNHVLDATASFVAPCRPVWDLFHAMRVLFCRHVMDPLNGFWFATVWCLLLLLAAIPLSVKLAACYRQTRPGSLLPRAHTESPPEAGNIPDPPEPSRPWASPGEAEPEGW